MGLLYVLISWKMINQDMLNHAKNTPVINIVIHEHSWLSISVSSSFYLINILFLMYKSFLSLIKFLIKYFPILKDVIKRIFFLSFG
jgi:hypothetical protein